MYRMCYDLVAATNQSEGVVCYIISNHIFLLNIETPCLHTTW